MASGTKSEFVVICDLLQELYALEGEFLRFHQFMFFVNKRYYESIGGEYSVRNDYTELGNAVGLYSSTVQDMFYVENIRYIRFLQDEIRKLRLEQKQKKGELL